VGEPPKRNGATKQPYERFIMIRTISIVTLTAMLSSILLCVTRAADSEWKIRTQVKLPSPASALAYSTDGARIAIGHPDGQVTVVNAKSGELIKVLNAHPKKVNSIQFISDDSRLVTMGDEQRACIWSTSDWSKVGEIERVAFSGGASPDGHWLAAQDPQQAIWLWDLSTLKPVKQLTEPGKGGTRNITFTGDSRYIATAYNMPWLINVDTGQLTSFVVAGEKKTGLKIDQEGNRASISLGTMQDDDAPTHRMMPSLSGSLVALGRGWYGRPTFVDVWDVSLMKRIERFKPKDAGTLTSFSFDNSLLAIEGAEKVTIWRIDRGKKVASVKADGIMQFSPKRIELAATNGNELSIFVP
jgi:WD40 repeat protein